MKYNIGFIGTGKMAEAIILGIQKAGSAKSIIGSSRTDARKRYMKEKIGINVAKDNSEVLNKSEILFLCVKPKDMKEVLYEIKGNINEHIIISIAAGVSISSIESIIGKKKIVRVMPNIACIVGEMAAGYSTSDSLNKEDIAIVSDLLEPSGKALLIEESSIDAVTALSGAGPAFVAYFIKGMIDAGVKQGLSYDDSAKLAVQTVFGTAKLMKQKDMTPQMIIDMVSSPSGSTIEGLKVLERTDFNKIIKDTVGAAAKRAAELGK